MKQIVGSTLTKGLTENFVSGHEPIHYAKLYASKELTGGHIVMLSQTEKDKLLVREIFRRFPQIYSLGGGMNASNALKWLQWGAGKIIFSSFIFAPPLSELLKRLNELQAILKKDQMVIDLSCVKKKGKYFVAGKQWSGTTDLEINRENLNLLGRFAQEFLVHSVDLEGKKQGIDLNLIKILAEESPINCVYGGGVSSYEDIELIKKWGRGKIFFTVGSGLDLFGGDLSLATVVEMSRIPSIER